MAGKAPKRIQDKTPHWMFAKDTEEGSTVEAIWQSDQSHTIELNTDYLGEEGHKAIFPDEIVDGTPKKAIIKIVENEEIKVPTETISHIMVGEKGQHYSVNGEATGLIQAFVRFLKKPEIHPVREIKNVEFGIDEITELLEKETGEDLHTATASTLCSEFCSSPKLLKKYGIDSEKGWAHPFGMFNEGKFEISLNRDAKPDEVTRVFKEIRRAVHTHPDIYVKSSVLQLLRNHERKLGIVPKSVKKERKSRPNA